MRLIRSAGQNVSPSDDGRLYDQIFTDGLFVDATITSLGTNSVSIPALYGIIRGRDFTADATTATVTLPESDTATGYIYVEINLSADTIISIGSSLSPFTPTYEDINVAGAVAQMIIAEYEASTTAVTSITMVYPLAGAGGNLETEFTVLANSWGNATTINSTTYYPYEIDLKIIAEAHPVIGIGAAGTLPTSAEQAAFDAWTYATVDDSTMKLTLYAEAIPNDDFVIIAKGVA